MKKWEMKHRRRSVVALVAASLGSHSVVMSTAVGKHLKRQQLNLNNNYLRRRRLSESLRHETHHRLTEEVDSRCVGSSLYPDATLQRNEFICHGQLRFGIDYRGRFILGFAENDEGTTPEMIAWQAKPTTLFVDPERPFSYVRLTEDGNILGFDSSYIEIYDSNYDDQNREQGKEDGSMLLATNDCQVAETVLPGTFCVILSSKAKPGMPNGMITWGVKVDIDEMAYFEPPTSAPTQVWTIQPSQQNIASPTAAKEESATALQWNTTNSSLFSMTSSVPTTRLTPSPSYSPSFTPSVNSIQIGSQAKKTIIYGYVWLDDDRDGKMGREENRWPNFEVKFYECVANGRVSAAGSVRTDSEGLYFIQLPYGEYRALYEVDQDSYGFSVGVQYSNSGWTDCMSSFGSIIVSSVGLYSVGATPENLVDVAMAGASIIPDLPPADEAAAESLTQEDFEQASKMSSITGFIYMDTNNNKSMDPDERSIAVKGYTVGDAIVKVSLVDCQPSNVVLPSVKFVPFPGHYMFGNLTEGSYKLKFELISVNPNITISSMYTYIDDTSEISVYRESQCGKLGQGQDNDQGDIGVQAVRALPFESDMENESASADFPFSSITSQSVGRAGNRSSGSDVSGIIGGVIVACVLVSGTVFFILRKQQPSRMFPLGGDQKDRNDNSGNLVDADISTTSDGGSTLVDRSAIGMYAVEQDLNDHESESSCSSDDNSDDDESYDDDSQQSSIDYGPVVSNIIAEYSQQQQMQQQQETQILSNDMESLSFEGQHQEYYHQSRHDPNIIGYPAQKYPSQHQHHDQYDSATTFSNNSADPPAASYTTLTNQSDVVHREGYEVQYEGHSPVHSDSDSEFSAENSNENAFFTGSPLRHSSGSRSRSNPRDNRDTSSWKRQAIPEHTTIVYKTHNVREKAASPHIDDNKSVISTGSDHSCDPPGASYKDTSFDIFPVHQTRQRGNRGRSVPPPPPRRFPSPQNQRFVSPQHQRFVSSQTSPSSGRISPYQPN